MDLTRTAELSNGLFVWIETRFAEECSDNWKCESETLTFVKETKLTMLQKVIFNWNTFLTSFLTSELLCLLGKK
jgi:hypothetical protein